MPQFADRVKTTSTSTGSSAITLSSSGATGYQAFPSSLDGETVGYVIEASGGTDWEIGTGVYTHSSLNLTRSLRSSSTGSLLTLGSGTHTVFLTPAFQDIQIVEAFSSTSDLPSASASHGRIYHVHGEAAMYFAHSGSWVKLANYSDITTYTHPNHSGEVTSTGDGSTVIADNVVDAANLKVSNSPTDGYVLTARSGNTGGMTWEAVSGGGGSSTSALTETTFSATANQTAFPVSGGITNAANISVFQNGVKLEEGASKDYTASASTNTVTLNSGAAAGDVVEVLEYGQPNSITDLSDTPSSLGTAGQVLKVNSGGTALEFSDASSGSGVTVYTGLSGTDDTPSGATYLLNASSPSAGDLAYVSSNTSLYQNNGNGWYRIAVINTTPTISSVADASSNTTPFTLEGGTNTVITVTASDADEGTDLTYSYSVTSGSLNGTTVTQGTGVNENVFTIAPHASNATTFSLTFTVSDSINAATSVAAFTLEFQITDSHYTTLLMATDGSAGDNNDITDSSSSSHTITVNGDAHAGTFSPYRHGGYSTYMVNTDDLTVASDADFNFGSGDFTIEYWIWPNGTPNDAVGFPDMRPASTNGAYVQININTSNQVGLYVDNAQRISQSSSTALTSNAWNHVCLARSGSTTTLYIGGASVGSWSDSTTYSQGRCLIAGHSFHTNRGWASGCYVADFRIVKGTAITPSSGGPTERLTAVTNTKLLACHLPYFADGSSSAHSITINGDPETKPFGPYDYQGYSESTNGGSVYFDGSGDYLNISSNTDFAIGTGNYTFECYIYPETVSTSDPMIFVTGNQSLNNTLWLTYGTTYSGLTLGYSGGGSGGRITTSQQLTVDAWNHVAVTRSSGTTYIFLNGTDLTSGGSTAHNNVSFAQNGFTIGKEPNGTDSTAVTGHISDARFVNGTAVYSGNFTPPTGPLTTTGGTYPSTTNVNTSITSGHTKLLISGTDGHVIDKSQVSNLKLFNDAAAVTDAPNNSTISSTNALSLDGTGDYATAIITPINGVDFTVEAWVRKSAQGSTQVICGTRTTSSDTTGFSLVVNSANELAFYTNAYNAQSSSLNFPANTWVHVAAVRSGNSLTLYKDGSSVATGTSSHTFSKDVMYIGQNVSTQYWNGYIQDLRVSVEKARTISVPSSPLKG